VKAKRLFSAEERRRMKKKEEGWKENTALPLYLVSAHSMLLIHAHYVAATVCVCLFAVSCSANSLYKHSAPWKEEACVLRCAERERKVCSCSAVLSFLWPLSGGMRARKRKSGSQPETAALAATPRRRILSPETAARRRGKAAKEGAERRRAERRGCDLCGGANDASSRLRGRRSLPSCLPAAVERKPHSKAHAETPVWFPSCSSCLPTSDPRKRRRR